MSKKISTRVLIICSHAVLEHTESDAFTLRKIGTLVSLLFSGFLIAFVALSYDVHQIFSLDILGFIQYTESHALGRADL